MMKKPKNIDDYTDVETAASGLEAVARDLRLNAAPGVWIKWNLNIRVWNDDWLKDHSPGQINVAGQGVSNAKR